jgi:hypothetical protein
MKILSEEDRRAFEEHQFVANWETGSAASTFTQFPPVLQQTCDFPLFGNVVSDGNYDFEHQSINDATAAIKFNYSDWMETLSVERDVDYILSNSLAGSSPEGLQMTPSTVLSGLNSNRLSGSSFYGSDLVSYPMKILIHQLVIPSPGRSKSSSISPQSNSFLTPTRKCHFCHFCSDL